MGYPSQIVMQTSTLLYPLIQPPTKNLRLHAHILVEVRSQVPNYEMMEFKFSSEDTWHVRELAIIPYA